MDWIGLPEWTGLDQMDWTNSVVRDLSSGKSGHTTSIVIICLITATNLKGHFI